MYIDTCACVLFIVLVHMACVELQLMLVLYAQTISTIAAPYETMQTISVPKAPKPKAQSPQNAAKIQYSICRA